jgi:predicted nucleic acid-binding protein
MNVVADASMIASLFLPLPHSEQSAHRIASWKREGLTLCAPTLLLYEISLIFHGAKAAGYIDSEQLHTLPGLLRQIGLEMIPPSEAIQEEALRYAELLGHSKTYDAHYLAVAKQKSAQLWTANNQLAAAAKMAGLDWVRFVGDK